MNKHEKFNESVKKYAAYVGCAGAIVGSYYLGRKIGRYQGVNSFAYAICMADSQLYKQVLEAIKTVL